jgi:hypothetical protein
MVVLYIHKETQPKDWVYGLNKGLSSYICRLDSTHHIANFLANSL